VDVLDALGIARAAVVGISMGGYVGFALWRRHPARVRGLVLADTRAGADSAETRERRRQLIDVARREGSAGVAEQQVTGLLGKTTRAQRPDIVDAVRGMMARTSVEGIVGQLEAMMARPDSTPLLPTIDVPTLVVVGDEDVLTPPSEARVVHAGVRGSRLEILERAGHLSSLERPAAFNVVVAEFVTALTAD
jgi:pimeloyl-ACP methyl ester carboxylesterase